MTAIYFQTTALFPLPDSSYSAKTLVEVLKHNDASIVVVAASVVEQLASDPVMLGLVSEKVDTIAYAGAAVSEAAGEEVTQHVQLFSLYACTENGVFPTIRPTGAWNRKSWNSLHFHPNSGLEFRHLGQQSYEAVVVKCQDIGNDQPVFRAFPELQEWSTKDILSPNPDIPDSWVYRSRIDDVIRFLDGTNFNPLPYEQQVSGHPDVVAAMMFGANKSQTALIIEMIDPQELHRFDHSEVIERLWPRILVANQSCPIQARITKSHIIFTQPGKPLPRTSKGTLKRTMAAELYAGQLNQLYSAGD